MSHDSGLKIQGNGTNPKIDFHNFISIKETHTVNIQTHFVSFKTIISHVITTLKTRTHTRNNTTTHLQPVCSHMYTSFLHQFFLAEISKANK